MPTPRVIPEFFAEIDVLCAISVCPHGDLSAPVWGPDAADAETVCRAPGVDVWASDLLLLEIWASPAPSACAGRHTLRGPDRAGSA